MLKHRFSLLAENAFTDGIGRLSIIQIFEEISSDIFPVIHPKIIVVSSYVSDETGPEIIFVAKILDENKKQLQHVEIRALETKGNINFLSEFSNILFEKPGTYTFVFTINGKLKQELPVKISLKNEK